jgi:hypothetical protein
MRMKLIITIGIALAVAVLASVTPSLIALPLWVIAVLLFGWGLKPKAMEELVGRLETILKFSRPGIEASQENWPFLPYTSSTRSV